MAGVNKVILVGHVGKDPEVKTTEKQVKVARLTLATTDYYKKDGQRVEQTEWHNITLWRGLAEIAERYVQKGALLYIEGKLKTRSWEDANKQKHYATEVEAETLNILSKKQPEGASGHQAAEPAFSDSYTEKEGELPF